MNEYIVLILCLFYHRRSHRALKVFGFLNMAFGGSQVITKMEITTAAATMNPNRLREKNSKMSM